MEKNIIFDLFSDSKETVITKICNYFNVSRLDVEKALGYGCSAESFINDLRINLNAFDSSKVSIIGRHVTTSTDEDIGSFFENGLYDLRLSLQEQTPLSHFLSKHHIQVNVDKHKLYWGKKVIPIEGKKHSDHICFMGRDSICSWYSGCETLQKLGVLYSKLYSLGATLEFFVGGTLDEMLNYSTVSHCPEILDTIDQIISSIKNPYGRCMFPLCYEWASLYRNCYIIEFESILSNMDTYNPISYLEAYNQIKGCFNYSDITYNDYYERRIPQCVFDNKYLIERIIDIYVYGYGEQYGSLQPGLSIKPDAIKIYSVQNNQLVAL